MATPQEATERRKLRTEREQASSDLNTRRSLYRWIDSVPSMSSQMAGAGFEKRNLKVRESSHK